MTIDKILKVRLTDEEKECLTLANAILRQIYYNACDALDYSCEVELEDDVQDIVNDISFIAESL